MFERNLYDSIMYEATSSICDEVRTSWENGFSAPVCMCSCLLDLRSCLIRSATVYLEICVGQTTWTVLLYIVQWSTVNHYATMISAQYCNKHINDRNSLLVTHYHASMVRLMLTDGASMTSWSMHCVSTVYGHIVLQPHAEGCVSDLMSWFSSSSDWGWKFRGVSVSTLPICLGFKVNQYACSEIVTVTKRFWHIALFYHCPIKCFIS
jgi:hypothetical protein